MKMRFVQLHSLLLLFLALALSFQRSPAQTGSLAPARGGSNDQSSNRTGFISLDCGTLDTTPYTDPDTTLSYYPDDDSIDDRIGVKGGRIAPEFETGVPKQYTYVRSFPGGRGTRGCYTLVLTYGKGYQILLRVGFLYGNYDGQNEVPQFDLYLGANHWETVTFDSPSSYFVTEIQHTPTSGSLQVCVVNTGKGTPFISLIELRPMVESVQSTYNTSSGSFKFLSRWDMGSSTPVRYKDDLYDRIWQPTPDSLAYVSNLATNETSNIITNNDLAIPAKILSTAVEAPSQSESLNISFSTDRSFYVYFHFVEVVVLNTSRVVNIYRNGDLWYGPLTVRYLIINTIYMDTANGPSEPGSYTYSITATDNSSAPAILNAFEAYTVIQFPESETNENDVAAIKDIKAAYNVTKNWQGDPCSPRNLTWTGIDCSYNSEPPSIISLNLSRSELAGSIAPSISNLTQLQSLDLSYNNLNGAIPESLSWLPTLKYLNLTGNNINTTLPPALLEKSRNGSLNIIFDRSDENKTHCGDGYPCKNKKNTTIIVASTVGSILGLVAVLTLIYFVTKRKRKAVRKVNIGSSKVTSFPFSEVMNVIGDKKIIGRGGFGTVYYGFMSGVEVAVKVFSSIQELRNRDFQSEVKILATVYHKNLTKIIGYCDEGSNKAIILEFVGNGNLQDHLSETSPNVLSWINRLSILTGAGEGLEYLHHGCKPPIIHRDIKPENVLITKDFEAKLADFGFSRIFPFQSSTVVGTLGYHDPTYVDPRMMTEKVDVYSFGVLMLNVVTGKPAIVQGTHITQWVSHYIQNGDMQHIVDARLNKDYNLNVAWRVVELAMACVSPNVPSRPNMQYVVKELKECLPIPHDQYDQDEWRSPNDERVLSSLRSSEIAPSER